MAAPCQTLINSAARASSAPSSAKRRGTQFGYGVTWRPIKNGGETLQAIYSIKKTSQMK
jgi:hypothetical protein